MPSIIDASAFIGDYPFRGFSKTSPAAFKELTQGYNITGAVVSSFYEIFWENNLDAVKRTHEQIGGDEFFHHFAVVNPAHPGQLDELPAVLDATSVRGLRLTPAYHGYRLWDERVKTLFKIAAERQLTVQIFRTVQDERMHWMLSVPPVASEDFERLISVPPSTNLMLCGLGYPDILSLSRKLPAAETGSGPSVYFDLSRVRGPVFATEKLTEAQGAERLIFGSLWPIQLVASSLRQINDARIPEEERARILGGNIESLLKGL